MEQKPVILMVEDEQSVLSANRRMLSRRGYEVLTAACAAEAYACLEVETPDLMVLDVMLPDGDGFEICSYFRKKSENPVLFLTGKDSLDDKLQGLSRGGDYYITKPYHFEELLAVVNRLLERSERAQQKARQQMVFQKGALEVDMQKSTVTLDGEPVFLTGKEYGLLQYFITHAGREISAEELYEQVWNTQAAQDLRTVRKHIMNLRNKIKAGQTDDYDIVTAYGKGYIFCISGK